MVIEFANVCDAEAILTLQKLAFHSEAAMNNNFNIPPLLQTVDEMKHDFQNHTFLKIVLNRIIVGSVKVFVKDGNCYIGRLIVHPDYQNKGLGTSLMKEIEKIFADCFRFELFTGEKSLKNIHFYQKLGYQIFKTEMVSDNLHLIYLEKFLSS